MKIYRRQGFTLIELSIVLVIIGLIVGGILVGRDLIIVAEHRQAVTDLEKLKTSIATFKNKYNCLPGDCANATDFFSCVDDATPNAIGGNNPCNGTGNELYDSDNGTAGTRHQTFEGSLRVWEQLGDAGLPFLGTYSGLWTNNGVVGWVPGVNTPKLSWGGSDYFGYPIGIYLISGTLCWWINGCEEYQLGILANPLPQNTIVLDGIASGNNEFTGGFGAVNSELASYIDTKTDDGLPLSGQVREFYYPPGAGYLQDCTDGTDNPGQPYAQNSFCKLLVNVGL